MVHIGEERDFTPVIEKALELGGYPEEHPMTGINGGTQVTTGYGHGTILSVADQVVAAVNPAPSAISIWSAAATARGRAATPTRSLSGTRRRTPSF